MTSNFMVSPRLGLGRTAPMDPTAVGRDSFRRSRRYGSGYRNAGQPTPSIAMRGIYPSRRPRSNGSGSAGEGLHAAFDGGRNRAFAGDGVEHDRGEVWP